MIHIVIVPFLWFLFYPSFNIADTTQRPIYIRLKANLTTLQNSSYHHEMNELRQFILHSVLNDEDPPIDELIRHRLDRYYQINPNELHNQTPQDVVYLLQNNTLVESVQIEPIASPAQESNETITPSYAIPDYTNCYGNAFKTCQKYMLDPLGQQGWKTGGVNAFNAQKQTQNYGANVRIIVMEIGCPLFNHIDINRQPFLKLGQIKTDDHSTMSLGIMAGLYNGFGVQGIAAQTQVGYAKWDPQMLLNLRYYVSRGDVLQIGVQYGDSGPYCPNPNDCWVPVESVDLVQDTIRYLTKEKGVHVIMAAANGNVNLDHPGFHGKYSRSKDSGGIYAGACDPMNGVRAWFSDYGSRVDVFSWGLEVTTTTWDGGRNDLFTTTYSGTSSANPIIAGCVAFLQSVARSKGFGNVDPATMRHILVNSGRSLPYPDGKNIGRQPDLVKAVQILNDRFANV